MTDFKALNVGIVGAGISGLASAIALRRAGHTVTIIESTSDLSKDASASVASAANATQWLKEWGVDWTPAGPTALQSLTMKKWGSGKVFNEFSMATYTEQWGSPYLMFDRNDLIKLLLGYATASSGEWTAAKVMLGKKVVGVDVAGGMELEGGEKLDFDLIIGADGVNSIVKSILPTAPSPTPNSATCVKFNVPVAAAVAAGLEDLTKAQGVMFWLGSENRKIVLSPTRGLRLMSFYTFFPCTETLRNDQPEGFHLPLLSVPDLLAIEPLQDLDPACYSLLSHAEDITQWKLLLQEELVNWSEGVVGVVGDAAHYMFPDQSQAPSTAIEDAAALGLVFSDPQFTAGPESIAKGLQTFEALRKPRATRVQSASARAREDVKERIGFSDQAAPPGGYKGVGEGKLTIQELNLYNMRGHLADIIAAQK